jgi:hypothetical protein
MLQVGMTIDRHVSHLTDAQLLTEVKRLAAAERHATAALLRALIELDERRLYLGEGCSSLFTYCPQVLHLSEGGAYNRIEAARAARRLPVLLELLEDGALTLTTIRLLAPHLTESNSGSLLDDARHKSKREVEELIARLRPKPDVAAVVRRLPTPALQLADQAPPTAESSSSPDSLPSVRPPVVKPLAPERYKLQLTISKETHDKLRHAQALVRHAVPDGDLAAIIDRALTVLLTELERTKLSATERPHSRQRASGKSRRVPAAVKRAVWARDGGQCAFVGSAGRCQETGFLEFHHVIPHAAGGEATVRNLELRCRAHNVFEAETYFGRIGTLFVREMSVWRVR